MSQNPTATLSHIGICTSNVDNSIQFYTEALGFVRERTLEDIGPPFDALIEMPGTKSCVHFLKSGDITIELISFLNSEVSGKAERRPMNQLGFTHLSVIADDVNATADRIVKYGGRVHPETKIDSPIGPMVFCTDPDGVRIELVQATA